MEALMTTVGSGSYQYEVVESWAKLPAGWTWGPVSAVATDSQDRVYAFQRKDPPIVVFDRDGNYLTSWGSSAIKDPHGIAIIDDVIYLTDRDDHVALKFTLDGKPLMVLGTRGQPSDTYFNARQVAYVSELRPSVSILDRNGKVLARFDSPSGHGLWVDSVGDIYLAEAGGKRLTKYVHKR